METKKNSILDFLSEYSVIELPVWQREFVWEKSQIEQLYMDIIAILNAPKSTSHFFGFFVTNHMPDNVSGIKLVDGHQRIIAISIFLCAACNFYKAERYKKALLFTSYKKQQISKVKYLNEFKEQYENILLNEDYAYMTKSAYSNLYRFFYDKISAKNYTLEHYFNALKRFDVIELILTEKENPQLIYDSLNSVRTNLNLMEKIKNYIFMGLDEKQQTELWSRYWRPIEHTFSYNDCLFTQFILAYITMHSDKKVTLDNLSILFNQYYSFKKNYKEQKDIMSEIFKFAQYFVRIKNVDFSQDIAIELEKIVSKYDIPELYAFLFEVTDDFQNNLIPKKTYIDILKNIYEYLKKSEENVSKINFKALSKNISQMLATKYK